MERLHQQYERKLKEEDTKAKWMTYESRNGKLVSVAAPWKTATAEERLDFCRSLYTRCAAAVASAGVLRCATALQFDRLGLVWLVQQQSRTESHRN